ncbi:MAG: hypothetical protein IT290_11170 [Deltaproteobacteria bacterium]|nr:hypothetical protein [Deltaproteobacteria bacterium]
MTRTLALLLLLSTGCVQRFYDGNALPDAEIVRVETRGADLEAVNGKRVENDSRVIEVMPGTNTIEATVATPLQSKKVSKLTFFGTAGALYYLVGRPGSPNCVKLENVRGEVVAEDQVGCRPNMVRASYAN